MANAESKADRDRSGLDSVEPGGKAVLGCDDKLDPVKTDPSVSEAINRVIGRWDAHLVRLREPGIGEKIDRVFGLRGNTKQRPIAGHSDEFPPIRERDGHRDGSNR